MKEETIIHKRTAPRLAGATAFLFVTIAFLGNAVLVTDYKILSSTLYWVIICIISFIVVAYYEKAYSKELRKDQIKS